jgi:nucleotide sugar dehydrogenase
MKIKSIAVIGTGYVGLSTGSCMAEAGHKVICVDVDENKINMLNKGKSHIYEYGIEDIIKKNLNKNLFFTTDIKKAIKDSEIIFVAVGTPPNPDGSADLSYIKNVAKTIADTMSSYKLIVHKSTVPVETGEAVEKFIKSNLKKDITFDIASVPEFLREGMAVYDTFNPDRIVIGVKTKRAEKLLREVYAPFKAKIFVTDIKSAELIKHASNSFLATKISYINSISLICEKVGANVEDVANGMGLDKRIGRSFLNAGIGFGGFCFPKDLDAFLWISKKHGCCFNILESVRETNLFMRKHFINKIEKVMGGLDGKDIAILGLSFKPNTDDMRYAPSIEIISALLEKGAKITAYDPQAMEKAKKKINGITFAKDAFEALKNKDCMVVLTEWDEFKKLDLDLVKKTLKKPIIIDGRNIYEIQDVIEKGFQYYSMGR